MTNDHARDCLTVADVLGMETLLWKSMGGVTGIRDPGALEFAIFRPMTYQLNAVKFRLPPSHSMNRSS